MRADELWPGNGQARLAGKAVGPLDGETRERLLEATERLIRQFGIAKMSMADVARVARVARGTLYRYFESREALLEAFVQRTTDRFFSDVGAAMDRCDTLAEQIGKFSELQIQSIHPGNEEAPGNQAVLIRQLAGQASQALRRTAKFLRPYLDAAQQRGEIRADIDVADASEWLARILLSFTIFQASPSFEADDPASVSSFVQRYAIKGLS